MDMPSWKGVPPMIAPGLNAPLTFIAGKSRVMSRSIEWAPSAAAPPMASIPREPDVARRPKSCTVSFAMPPTVGDSPQAERLELLPCAAAGTVLPSTAVSTIAAHTWFLFMSVPLEADELPVAAAQAEIRVDRRFPGGVCSAEGTQLHLDERAVGVRHSRDDRKLRRTAGRPPELLAGAGGVVVGE